MKMYKLLSELSAGLLIFSLGAACKSTANSSNASSATTTTTAVSNKSTMPVNANTETTGKPTPGSTSSSELHTPPEGSSERNAILDGIRDHLKTKENFPNAVIEEVEYLKVHNGWAYITCFAGAPDGHPYGSIEALMREQNGRWKVVEVLEYENSTEKEDRAAFRARHKDAPEDIFPPAS